MATRDQRRDEEAKDDRQAEERRDDRAAARKRRGRRHHERGGGAATGTSTVNERLKALSHQSGSQAMQAAPSDLQAVYSTGPGQAVEYNYVRVDGGGEEYARQQSSYATTPSPPVSGFGQTLTTGSMAGAANNPT